MTNRAPCSITCEQGLIEGAKKLADMWVLPPDAQKPIDGRTKTARKLAIEKPYDK